MTIQNIKGKVGVKGVCGKYTFLTKAVKKYKSEDKQYKAILIISKEDGEALLALMEAAQKAELKKQKEEGKASKKGEIYGISILPKYDSSGKPLTDDEGEVIPDPSGKYLVRIKLDEKDRDGVAQKIHLLDSAGRKLEPKRIGDGSTIKGIFSINAYSLGGKSSVSLKIVAVMIIDLVDVGLLSDEDAAEFAEEDGYIEGESNASNDSEDTEDDEVGY